MSDPNIVVPLPDDGRRGPRLEIDEFLMDNPMTNLFLIALHSLQQDSLGTVDGKPKWMNFYNIGGIHGQPDENWNDVAFKKPEYGAWVGYCHHREDTFPTWHRPYMNLFELAVFREMENLAKQYQDGDERRIYEDAAARFRLPYWDLVMPRHAQKGNDPSTVWGCPKIFAQSEVTVKLPVSSKPKGDRWESITNPLYSFQFPSEAERLQAPGRARIQWDYMVTANRPNIVPFNQEYTTRTSDLDLAIQRQGAARATLMWQMLNPDITAGELGGSQDIALENVNKWRTWSQFANATPSPNPADGNTVRIKGRGIKVPSLESFHDGIHVLVGSATWRDPTGRAGNVIETRNTRTPGHMGDTAWAAFDPIFFLHHCNIDRLLALYQAINPDRYVDATQAKVQLQPFLTGKSVGGQQECWSSADPWVKDYWNAGFAIPGNKKPDLNTKLADVRQTIKTYLSNNYYWAANKLPHKSTLPDWPKNLSGSWALYGRPQSSDVSQPLKEMSTVRLENGIPKIFVQKLQASSQNALPATQLPILEEHALQTSNVLQHTEAIDSSLPKGTFIEASTAENAPVQITWNAYIKIRKYAFRGSFSVHLFTGWVKDDQAERYMTKKNEAGFMGVFSTDPSRIEHCSSCEAKRDADEDTEDVVPLTTHLFDYLRSNPLSENLIVEGNHRQIDDLTAASVVPFLKEQLKWRIIDLGANLIQGQEQESELEITVVSREFTPPTAQNIMGVYGPDTVHAEITSDKPGGYGYVYPA